MCPQVIQLEERLQKIRHELKHPALSQADRDRLIDYYLTVASEALDADSEKLGMKAFLEVAYLKSVIIDKRPVWGWITSRAKVADDREKEELAEAILELVTEDPIYSEDIRELWRLWADENTRWTVLRAYRRCPSLMEEHSWLYREA